MQINVEFSLPFLPDMSGIAAANEKFVRWLHKWETCRHFVFLVEHVLRQRGHFLRFISRVFLFKGTATELRVILPLTPCGGGGNRGLIVKRLVNIVKNKQKYVFPPSCQVRTRPQTILSSAHYNCDITTGAKRRALRHT